MWSMLPLVVPGNNENETRNKLNKTYLVYQHTDLQNWARAVLQATLLACHRAKTETLVIAARDAWAHLSLPRDLLKTFESRAQAQPDQFTPLFLYVFFCERTMYKEKRHSYFLT